MLGVIEVQNFGDTFLVVAVITTAFMAGAAWGFRQAIKSVADHIDEKPRYLAPRSTAAKNTCSPS